MPLFQQFITTSKRGKRLKYNGKKLTPGTIVQYQCLEKLLREYENKHQITLQLLLLKKHSLPEVKKQKKYWDNFFTAFIEFLYRDKQCFDNYVSSLCKTLKAFFNYLVEEKQLPIGNFHKRFRVTQQPVSPLILEPTQLKVLISDKAFEDALPKSLQRTKDIFVFGCTVALRYSDLMNLKKDHVINAPEGKYLLVNTQKTSTLVKIPLPAYLLLIIEKYKSKKGKFLLPRLSSTNLNLQVKELCKRAGWDYSVPKVRYKMGKPIELKNKQKQCFKFHEQVTTHTMRRTAITTLLIMGVPELVVRRISGHSAHSREFYRYVVVAQDYLNKHVREAYEKLST